MKIAYGKTVGYFILYGARYNKSPAGSRAFWLLDRGYVRIDGRIYLKRKGAGIKRKDALHG